MPQPFRAFDYVLCGAAVFLTGVAVVPFDDELDSLSANLQISARPKCGPQVPYIQPFGVTFSVGFLAHSSEKLGL
jgi:hypothetical protein